MPRHSILISACAFSIFFASARSSSLMTCPVSLRRPLSVAISSDDAAIHFCMPMKPRPRSLAASAVRSAPGGISASFARTSSSTSAGLFVFRSSRLIPRRLKASAVASEPLPLVFTASMPLESIMVALLPASIDTP